MKIEQIAINGVSTAQTNLPEMLRAYADAGFRNIEMPFGTVKKYLTDHTITDLKKLFADFNLRFIGGFETHVAVFATDNERQKNHDLQRQNADLIAELGGGILVAGTDGPEQRSAESLVEVGTTFRTLAESFPPSVSLALEFNWSPLVKSIRSAYRAVESANHPRVGILFDPAHYHCTASKMEDLTAVVVARIIHVHVNDMNDKPGELSDCNSDRVLPGAGILPLHALFARLDEHGYNGFYSIELFNQHIWSLPVDEAARQCYQAMRGLSG